jgi:hypothetical protein
VLRKEPMSKDIGESDVFIYNAGFHSKFYKVKIGTVSAQKETEPEKQETRQKVSHPPSISSPAQALQTVVHASLALPYDM